MQSLMLVSSSRQASTLGLCSLIDIGLVEALYAHNANPIISSLALDGIAKRAKALPILMDKPRDLEARSGAQYGALLCSMCLGAVGMCLHHKLCHTLGGSFGLPHAQIHAIVLPHAVAYDAPVIGYVISRLAAVLPRSEGSAVRGLNILFDKLRVKGGLKAFGMEECDVEKAAAIVVERAYWNPRVIEKEKPVEVLRRCWAGEEARSDVWTNRRQFHGQMPSSTSVELMRPDYLLYHILDSQKGLIIQSRLLPLSLAESSPVPPN